jgi:uncharacterized protein (TIGR02466 family)
MFNYAYLLLLPVGKIKYRMQNLIFPTRIDIHDLSQDPDFEKVKQIIQLQESQATPHLLLDNALSTYTSSNIPILDHIALTGFRKRLDSLVHAMALDLRLAPITINNSWFNIMGEGQRVEPHRHMMSVISGAFYTEAAPNSAGLRFHSPLAQLRMNEMLLGSNGLNADFHEVECKEGLLILFPSWLEHSTAVNPSKRRVTVSFNSGYGPEKLVNDVFKKWRTG